MNIRSTLFRFFYSEKVTLDTSGGYCLQFLEQPLTPALIFDKYAIFTLYWDHCNDPAGNSYISCPYPLQGCTFVGFVKGLCALKTKRGSKKILVRNSVNMLYIIGSVLLDDWIPLFTYRLLYPFLCLCKRTLLPSLLRNTNYR